MTCEHCGSRCKGRLCRQCELDEKWTDAARARFDGGDDPMGVCSRCGCEARLVDGRCADCRERDADSDHEGVTSDDA